MSGRRGRRRVSKRAGGAGAWLFQRDFFAGPRVAYGALGISLHVVLHELQVVRLHENFPVFVDEVDHKYNVAWTAGREKRVGSTP